MAPEGGRSQRLVVSVHDIAPRSLPDVEWLLARLDAAGVDRRVLKVIPADAGEAMAPDGAAATLLRAEQARGSEIVLHGLSHRVPPGARLGGSPLDRIRARAFAADAAEFLALDPAAADTAILRGLEIMAAAGLRAAGFCAPAWLARPGLASILRRRGFRHAAWFGSVEDLATGRRLRVPAWGYMGADGAGEVLVGLERQLVTRVSGRLGISRVFLHPAGAPRSRACAGVLRAVERLARERAPSTYVEVLDA